MKSRKVVGGILAVATAVSSSVVYFLNIPDKPDKQYRLVWNDEFNTPLNRNVWYVEQGCGIRKKPLQCFTAKEKNIRTENGFLIIEGHKEDNAEYPYSAASMLTRWPAWHHPERTRTFQYGRIEMRAKLPDGKGVWPAFWTTGHGKGVRPWPACGEVDIFEYVGKDPNVLYSTVHWESDKGEHLQEQDKVKFNPSEFNVFAIEWDEEKIKFFLNDHNYYTYTNSKAQNGEYNPFQVPHIIRINFSIGGSWGGQVDSNIFPQQYIIDYVRVYQEMRKPQPADLQAIYSLLLNGD